MPPARLWSFVCAALSVAGVWLTCGADAAGFVMLGWAALAACAAAVAIAAGDEVRE